MADNQLKKAMEAYKTADAALMAALEDIFGKENLKGNLMDRVHSLDDLFREAGKDPAAYAIPENGTYTEKADMYLARLMLAEELFNAGEVIDLANTDQKKHYPYFEIIKDKKALAGFRLSYRVCGYDLDGAHLGARPEFTRSEHAVHVGKILQPEYEAMAQNRQMARNQKK